MPLLANAPIVQRLVTNHAINSVGIHGEAEAPSLK
jgi:hypothetical protein